ncbi:OmpA family protein [Malaciobacter mytili]|uniref:Flagellar motor protein MotB n=1 Tax=Malaciobacter mytili LMG 24559 TaxID=1032238 RepID=A0AAX2AJF9_9BACT|nr:OmpA family protein [Malaciobacter mytili]AXH14193.1 outer membrane fibronectin-binding protein [Malaciobacter mytili LMG 24559]RXI48729.1 flagellar motor protein MotB [Malaciobacter mytili]RXK16279.1 flagellar motor protein MotB [Malaciobacter mytili LMG 24559]
MKKLLLSTIACASLVFAQSEYKYEITPLVGGVVTEGNMNLDDHYGVGGLSLGFNLENSMFDQIELGFLTSLGDVDYSDNKDTSVTRIFSNLIKEYELSAKSSLYALIGAGVEVYQNEAFKNESGLFGNYGVGFKYKINDNMALKTDIRHLIETDHGDNNLIYTVGLAIPFGKKAAPVVEEKPAVVEQKVIEPTPVELDSDNDGVVDSLDKCPNTPKGDIVDETGCSLKVDLNINFNFDSAKINNSYDSKIKKFAEFMKKYPSTKAKIEAHTDSIGSDEYNQKLSERRAASTVKALKAYNIDENRLKSFGYGESKPLATNDTKDGRAQNRRVEATIQK